MMNHVEREQQIKHVQMTIDQAKEHIAKRNALYRLLDNKDFKEIIDIGYFRDEAARLVGARMDANLQGEQEQKHINRLIDGVGGLRHYLHQIERMGNSSERALADHENTREELLSEQLMGSEGAQA